MLTNFRKFVVYCFSVLLTKLLYDLVMKALPIIKSTHNPYFDVAIGMALTLIIFFPLYKLTSNWMKIFSGHYVKHTKKIHRNNYIALFIGYVIGMIILFGCFMMVKFNINIITALWEKISG